MKIKLSANKSGCSEISLTMECILCSHEEVVKSVSGCLLVLGSNEKHRDLMDVIFGDIDFIHWYEGETLFTIESL